MRGIPTACIGALVLVISTGFSSGDAARGAAFLQGSDQIAYHRFNKDSNSFDIHVMSDEGVELLRLTDSEVNERLPAWSPGGTKIAFVASTPGSGKSDIYTMNADGSNVTLLTAALTGQERESSSPSWSPDGAKIAFWTREDARLSDNDIYIVNADGTDARPLLAGPTDDALPKWSPDGSKITFLRVEQGMAAIYVMNADGGGVSRLSPPSTAAGSFDWSPDGSQIAFVHARNGNVDIYTMNSDGSDIRNLTQSPEEDFDPDWSPDGTRILFSRGALASDVYVMNADGTGQTNLTNDLTAVNSGADWRPVSASAGGLPGTGGSPSDRESGWPDAWPLAAVLGALILGTCGILALRTIRAGKS